MILIPLETVLNKILDVNKNIYLDELWFAVIIDMLGFLIYSVTPFFLLLLYKNIIGQRVYTF